MKKIYDGQEMSRMDQWAIQQAGIPGRTLMERAAQGVVQRILARGKKRTAVLCGTGNNGGDGFAIARLLHAQHVPTDVYIIGKKEKLSGMTDAAANYQMLAPLGIPVFWRVPEKAEEYGCIVDALFGTGLSREITGEAERAIGWCNEKRQSGAYVIAVDIPSGIHSGTGQILGCAVHADKTVTFSRYKTGLCLYPGREYAGQIDLQEIGIPQENPIEAMGQKYLFEREDAVQSLPPRQIDSHKGTYGKVLVTAGSPGMMGAAVFAAKAAYHTGAGLVRTVIPQKESAVMTLSVPEAVQILYDDPAQVKITPDVTAAVVGPGLGNHEELFFQILRELPEEVPLVVDADGLNILARHGGMHRSGMILTPHMGEAARLSGRSAKELLADLPAAAVSLARQYEAAVVLKGAATVTADPWGRIAMNTTGNPGMSTAGSGDVLAGTIAGLCAQQRDGDLWKMAACGVWLHGRAGDRAAEEVGQYALTASDIIRFLRPDHLILS